MSQLSLSGKVANFFTHTGHALRGLVNTFTLCIKNMLYVDQLCIFPVENVSLSNTIIF